MDTDDWLEAAYEDRYVIDREDDDYDDYEEEEYDRDGDE